jgi:predicted DNA repair protein MutK
MAAGSLLALFDDIATILDDVSVMTKVAAKKTAGVLGDDLALNAQQVSGVKSERELPVVWAVAKGSFINKLILVPAALAISYFLPWLLTPLLMIGGAYLCFEGFEKIAHKFLHSKHEDEAHKEEIAKAVADPKADLVLLEKDKIKGAIRTDFILSAEIIVIALGSAKASGASFAQQSLVVALIALVITFGVYGLVAGIVKMDDAGLHLMTKKGQSFWRQLQRKTGEKLLSFAPILMRILAVVGTAAMFLVGGSIIKHGIPALQNLSDTLTKSIENLQTVGGVLGTISPIVIDGIIGLITGAICLAAVEIIKKLMPKKG